jgi:uncharacterized protein involved in response to NO
MRIPLLAQGFRPFFLLAGLWAVLSLAAWILLLESGLALPSRFAPMEWHIHEMIFGMVMAAIGGFLLTAIPNWTARLPVSGAPLALLASCWLLGRLVTACSALLPAVLAVAGDLLFPLTLIFVAAREIVAGRNWRNLVVILPLSVLALADLLMHLAALGAALPFGLGWRLALAAICFLIALIGGRIVPSFTRNWLKKTGRTDLRPDRKILTASALIALAIALLGWTFLPESRIVSGLLLLAAGLHLVRLVRWHGLRTRAEPLLLILHLGYGWLVAGLGLLGLSGLVAAIPASAAIHALTAGAAGTMILAVMTRATRGHTGRELTAGRPTVAIYGLATLAALLRVCAALALPFALPALRLSALAWIGAFGLFVAVYGPMLWSRRRT